MVSGDVSASVPVLRRKFEIGETSAKSGGLSISNQELISHGCKNCIWRLHKQCVHGVVNDSDFYEYNDVMSDGKLQCYSGYCPEYIDFILSFAEAGDSTSNLWEKFSLYVARMQSLDDYRKYIELRDKIDLLEAGDVVDDPEKLHTLSMKKELLRMWWERLNHAVRKGYSHIADRESRLKENRVGMPGILNAKVINFNMNKQIEDKK